MPGTPAGINVYSTSHAIPAERVLHTTGIQTKLIPSPRHLSRSCGVCVRIAWPDRDAVRQALREAGVEIDVVCDLQ